MERHFDQELVDLKENLLRLAGFAEQSVAQALKALVQRDDALAKKVDADDGVFDKLEIEIDDRGIKLLSLRQPTATDRFITMAMRLFQGIGTHRRSGRQHRPPGRGVEQGTVVETAGRYPRMADVRGMIHDTLDAFVYAKPDLARAVVARDAKVDLLNRQLHRELTSFMIEDPHTITRCLNLMSVAHNLERIADHATNIAEDIVYLYEGRDIRHQNG